MASMANGRSYFRGWKEDPDYGAGVPNKGHFSGNEEP